MRFSQLAAFCKVVELGSFTRAAKALVVTQPAVSLHVRSLEQELGVRLLDRQGPEVVTTPAGQVLYERARSILNTRDVAEREIAALQAGRRETLTLGASATGMVYHLPPLLKAFRDRQPSYEVLTRVDITDRVVQWTADGRVDLALVWGPIDRADVIEERLGHEDLALVCPPDHPLACGGAATGAQLADSPFILASQGSMTRRFVEGRLARVGVGRPRVAAEFSTTADMKRAVEAGMGIAIVGLRAVEEELQAGRLREVQVEGLQLSRPVSLIASRQRPLAPGTAILAGFLARELRLRDRHPKGGVHPAARLPFLRSGARSRDAAPHARARSAPAAARSQPPAARLAGAVQRLPVDAAGTVRCPWRRGERIEVAGCLSPEPCVCLQSVQPSGQGTWLICSHPTAATSQAAAALESTR